MVDPDGNPRCPSKVIVFNSNSFIKYLTKTVYIQTIRFYEKQELLILNQIKICSLQYTVLQSWQSFFNTMMK